MGVFRYYGLGEAFDRVATANCPIGATFTKKCSTGEWRDFTLYFSSQWCFSRFYYELMKKHKYLLVAFHGASHGYNP